MKHNIFRAIGALLLTIGTIVTGVQPAAAHVTQSNPCASLEAYLANPGLPDDVKKYISMALGYCVAATSGLPIEVDGWNGVDVEMQTADAVKLINDAWVADKATCHSNPNKLMASLEITRGMFSGESWDGSADYTVEDPGTAGVAIVVTDLKGKAATLNGKRLFRDRQDKLVAVYLREDKGVYTVHDAVTFPKGTSGFLIRLADPLDHAVAFSFWGDKHNPQDCNEGVVRAQARQSMPAGQPWVGSVVKIDATEVVSKLNALKGMDTLYPTLLSAAAPVSGTIDVKNGVTVVLLKDGSSTNGKNLVQLDQSSGYSAFVAGKDEKVVITGEAWVITLTKALDPAKDLTWWGKGY